MKQSYHSAELPAVGGRVLITEFWAPETGSTGVGEAVPAFLQQQEEGVGSLQASWARLWE